jgi:hypothetical protein
MQEYKKRIRLLAERFGGSIDYAHDGGLAVSTSEGCIRFRPISKSDMNCVLMTSEGEIAFAYAKRYVFDIILRFVWCSPLEGYKPIGMPLTLQDFIDGERAGERISELMRHVSGGTAKNERLGGNYYNAEYYNGILILFDILLVSPANVVEFNVGSGAR